MASSVVVGQTIARIGAGVGIAVLCSAMPAVAQPAQQSRAEQSGTSNNRLFGTLPDFLTVENAEHIPPLTTRQKFDVTVRSTFDWGQFLFYGVIAGVSQAENADPSYGRDASGYAKRFGLAFVDG